jgi:4'-phosphopantetheinyl transferase EntD
LNVLEAAWRELLPSCISVSAGPPLSEAISLSLKERSSLGTVGEERRREFESGRIYAKRALSMIGVNSAELPRRADGKPAWPKDIVGSITHAKSGMEGHIAVAVGRNQDVRAVGIDVEYNHFLQPHIWPHILTQREMSDVLDLPVVARASEVISRWCIKEALAKAMGRPFNPSDVAVERISHENERPIKWSFGTPDSPDILGNWRASSMILDSLILAAVVAQ